MPLVDLQRPPESRRRLTIFFRLEVLVPKERVRVRELRLQLPSPPEAFYRFLVATLQRERIAHRTPRLWREVVAVGELVAQECELHVVLEVPQHGRIHFNIV